MDFKKLREFLESKGQKPYRLAQVKEAYFVQLADSWDKVTTWPKELREAAKAEIGWDSMNQITIQQSSAGDTVKFLFECHDGSRIETVLMRHDHRDTVCISCQVGCPMGCAFCATGTMGLKRNLSCEEIVEQVVRIARWLKDGDQRSENGEQKGAMEIIRSPISDLRSRHDIENVVYMGMGEPMNNYDQVMDSIREINDPKGLAIGVRHVSVSTCGIVPGILKLADDPLRINLAISLHGATDEVRSQIMPVNKAYPIAKLMDAVDAYVEKTNRKVLFEYLMLKGVNDRKEDADALAKLMSHKKHLYHVNVIKYHDTGAFKHTEDEGRVRFVEWLREKGIQVTHRRTFGEDIDAACGQLASAEVENEFFEGKEAARLNREKRKK